MTKNRLPKTLKAFAGAIAKNPAWCACRLPAEPDDDTSPSRAIFWLASDQHRQAIVAFEYGRLIVTIDPEHMGYWFDLDRLHEHGPGWSWQKQLAGKNWCKPEYLRLIDELCRLFPAELQHEYQRCATGTTLWATYQSAIQ